MVFVCNVYSDCSIPAIKQAIFEKIAEFDKENNSLPRPIKNPQKEMNILFNKFFSIVSGYTSGHETWPQLQIVLKRRYDSMKENLTKTKLEFISTGPKATEQLSITDHFWETIDVKQLPSKLPPPLDSKL